MITSIELQVISRMLTTESEDEINTLCDFDDSYYSVFKPHIQFIFEHKRKYSSVPDVFTFQSQFPDVVLVKVTEPLTYLQSEMRKNKQHILLIETFNKVKDLGSDDVSEAWRYLEMQCDRASQLDDMKPMNIIKEAKKRSEQVIEYSKQSRIPTGFPEIDKLMYGGLSTVEELVVILARTNTGKSWFCTKVMESAQGNGFNVAYYSPEMQSAFLATRFDTWRGHFQNSQLFRGNYTAEYYKYIQELSKQETDAFIIEDKDMEDGFVSVRKLESFVKKNNIKLLVVDGISYLVDDQKSERDHEKYKHIAGDLFKLSKDNGCAVMLVMQANRETKESKDDKGDPFPNMYNAEGSDHPARIATQVFSLRQIFDKHVLDIRLEKSRMANNQNPILSYSWDVNTGNMQYLPGGPDDDPISNAITPPPSPVIASTIQPNNDDINLDDYDDDDVEF